MAIRFSSNFRGGGEARGVWRFLPRQSPAAFTAMLVAGVLVALPMLALILVAVLAGMIVFVLLSVLAKLFLGLQRVAGWFGGGSGAPSVGTGAAGAAGGAGGAGSGPDDGRRNVRVVQREPEL